jgi:magnesium and cobalt transporter
MNGDGEAIDTIGGLVFRLFGRVPVAGESIAAPGGFTLDVLDADQRRVKKVRILAPQPDSDGGEAVPEARAARA